ncbi:hypothetical protein C0992_010996 [Termitomyces sp. T32_za158]|nr:hypothetical protein C0992_010996 [Termitomyces sp. T32_za158]
MTSLLVILAADEADHTWRAWQNVDSILHKHLPTLGNVLVYTGHRDGVVNSRILLCSGSVSSSTLDAAHHDLLQDFVGVFKAVPEFRLYQPVMNSLGISSLNAEQSETLAPRHVLLSVALTPHLSADEELNDWYREEHIPLLMRVPTWISSERFKLEFSVNQQVPQYLALHRWATVDAFDTEEYQAATNTPRRSAVMTEIVKVERFLAAYEGKLEALSRENVHCA